MREDTVFVASGDGHLYAVNAEDGTERWHFETAETQQSAPTVTDDTVFVGSFDGGEMAGGLHAVNIEDGSERWFFETSYNIGSPAISDGTVYIPGDKLYAVDAIDGTEQWSINNWSGELTSPIVIDGSVYVGSLDDHLYVINSADGSEQWNYKFDGSISGTPALVDQFLFTTDIDGRLYALYPPTE